MIKELIHVIETDKTSLKFYCTKAIRKASIKKPEAVYRYFDDIAALLDNENSFVKWDAISILANLAEADADKKFDAVFDKYFGLINSPQMITASNVVGSAHKIITARPEWEGRITKILLGVPGIVYYHKGRPSPECNNVICGHVIKAFGKYFDVSENKKDIMEFVKGQIKNERKKTAEAALKFLKKHSL